jgi:hypothetical protein
VHSGSETGFVANPSITDILFVLVSFKHNGYPLRPLLLQALRVLSSLLLGQLVVCKSFLVKYTTDFAFASSHTFGKLSVFFTGKCK